MSREHHQRVLELFAATYEAEPAERREVLQRECGDDAALRAEVERMFAHHDGDESFLEQPALEAGFRSPPAGAERPGQLVDRYELLEKIGEGGFGVVYMAEQREPVRRRVALKIIKLGMDTKQVIARFEAERQALAMMDHPNIARVLDAGTTETGRPFFVMELVQGEPVTDYCDRECLTTEERLEVFQQVCLGVQHAHQKGVVHRDLKPGNVLVTVADGRPISKIIDFGIAKAMDRALTERTLFTDFRQLLGTPEYMSPEQAEMTSADVDTRSDIYSLGVLLYELLTGLTPFESERLRNASLADMQRIIREEDPPRPSTRLSVLINGRRASTEDEERSSIQYIIRHRHTDAARLKRVLRSDLDWIVMKCLEKDRARRYDTAKGLANDIGRYLADRPVIAGPPGMAYVVRKLVRRHKVAMTAAAVVLAVLVLGIVGTTWGMFQAIQAKNTVTGEKENAVAALDQYEALSSMFLDFFDIRPEQRSSYDSLFSARIEEIERRLDAEEFENPLLEAMLHEFLGQAYLSFNRVDASGSHLEHAVQLREDVIGRVDLALINSITLLARDRIKRGRIPAGIRLLGRVVSLRREYLGAEHMRTAPDGNLGRLVALYLPGEPEADEYLATRSMDRPGRSTDVESGQVLVEEEFDSRSLDPAWNTDLEEKSYWQYAVADSRLTLTLDDLESSVQPDGRQTNAYVSREFAPVSDFEVAVNIGWNSGGAPTATNAVSVCLLSPEQDLLLKVAYDDGWSAGYGRKAALLFSDGRISRTAVTGPSTLPARGDASLSIGREGNVVSIAWDDVEFQRWFVTEPVGWILVQFAYVPARDDAGALSTFGSCWVDSVRVSGVLAET